MNIALIGYRATGKTSVAQLLSQKMSGWNWVDADIEIEQAAGKTIAQIFHDDGENAFRDWEVEITRQLCLRPQTIISTGGGVVIRAENRDILKQSAFVVWLTARPETIYQRMYADKTTATRRPALTDQKPMQEIISVLSVRTKWYEQIATISENTDFKTPSEIADSIVEQYTHRIKSVR